MRRIVDKVSRRGSIARLLDAGPGLAAGAARALGAACADVAGTVDPRRLTGGRPSADPLDVRDPDYIRGTLPALRAMSDLYFRAEVRGMDNVPARGPALLVGNHSGGTLVVDTFVFARAFYDHFGADREFYQLAHDLVFKVPVRGQGNAGQPRVDRGSGRVHFGPTTER